PRIRSGCRPPTRGWPKTSSASSGRTHMLNAMITWTTDLVYRVGFYLGPIPNPGQGSAPPGSDKFEMLLGWAKWGAFFFCVAGFIIIGGRMGINHKRGEGGGHMGSLGITGAGCVVVGAAFLIVQKIAGA